MSAGFLTVDGAALEFRWTRPDLSDEPPIVLLHEGLGSVGMWRDFPDRLAAATNRAVFAYSRRGYGASSPLPGRREPNYMHHEAEVVLPEILRVAEIRNPILFGHSDGGSIALIYAGMYPDKPSGLILEAPHVFVEELTISSIRSSREAFIQSDVSVRLGRYHQNAEETFWGWNDIWLDDRFLKWNIEFYLPRIKCPILLIQGEDDPYGTTAQLTSIAERTGRAEILLLPNCAHSPHRDQSSAVLDSAHAFVRRLSKGTVS
jgi:pimeloyl-ACP methyl ester carboxylesterase